MEYKRQIQIQDQTRDRNPITLGRLVEHVARTVQRFIERPPQVRRPVFHCCAVFTSVSSQRNEDDFDPRWTVGARGITMNDIILVGIVHSSAGTWQPILRLSRPLPHLAQSFTTSAFQQPLHSAPFQPPSPEFPFGYGHPVASADSYHLGHAPSPEQFTIAQSPSPPQQPPYPNSYPSSPNPQMLYPDSGYLAPSPPYSAYPYT